MGWQTAVAAEGLALAAAFCFGLALVLTQFGLRHLRPAQGAAVSIPCSALLLWLGAPVWVDGASAALAGATVFALVGLLFPVVVTLLTFEANRRLGPNVSAALGNLAPLFAVTLAVVVLGEIPTARQAGGIAVIVAGVVLVSAGRGRGAQGWPWWVILLPLAAAAIRGAVQPAVRLGLDAWPDPYAAVLIGYTASALVGAAIHFARPRPGAVWPVPGLLWFAGVGASNVAAVLLMYAALARAPVALVSPLVATYPLATFAIAALVLPRTRLLWREALGIGATVLGVWLLLRG